MRATWPTVGMPARFQKKQDDGEGRRDGGAKRVGEQKQKARGSGEQDDSTTSLGRNDARGAGDSGGGGRRSREMTEAIFIRVIKFLIVEFVTMNSGIFYLYGLKDECKRKVMLSFTDSKWRLAGSSTINSVVAASVRNSPQKVCNLLSKIK